MMMPLPDILHIIDEVRTRHDANELAAVYKRFENAELPPAYLVDKARAIQLADGGEYSLDDVEASLRLAIELDKNYLDAYVELGCFYDAVCDAPDKALEVFNSGLEICKGFVAELDICRAKALIQINRVDEAMGILSEEKYLGVERFELLRSEIFDG